MNAAGQLSAAEFKRIEDRAVDEAIELQEGIGLDVITDGEFRRFSFFDQIVSEIDGTAPIESAPVHFKNAEADWVWHNPFTVTGKISQRRKLTIEEFAYNRARADSQIKITLPSPLFLYSGWSPELSTAAYKDAFALFEDAAAKQGVLPGQLTLHADRGASMKAKATALLLADLGVTKSHSRPHTSNDNPFSESLFKTCKYQPQFPQRFGSIQDAKAFCRRFFDWYNRDHHHLGIGLMTPNQVHYGQADEV